MVPDARLEAGTCAKATCAKEEAMKEQYTVHLPVVRYRDKDGNPTCAADFQTGDDPRRLVPGVGA